MGLLSDIATPNASDIQENNFPQISMIPNEELKKSLFEESLVSIQGENSSLLKKINEIKKSRAVKKKILFTKVRTFSGSFDEEHDSLIEGSSGNEDTT